MSPREAEQSVFPWFSRHRGASSAGKQNIHSVARLPSAEGENYFFSFHRFLISLRNEKKALAVVAEKFGNRNHVPTDKHAIAISSLSLSLLFGVYFGIPSFTRKMGSEDVTRGGKTRLQAPARPARLTSLPLSLYLSFFADISHRMAISRNEAFSRVVPRRSGCVDDVE